MDNNTTQRRPGFILTDRELAFLLADDEQRIAKLDDLTVRDLVVPTLRGWGLLDGDCLLTEAGEAEATAQRAKRDGAPRRRGRRAADPVKELDRQIDAELAHIRAAFDVERLHGQWAGKGWAEAEAYEAAHVAPLRDERLNVRMAIVRAEAEAGRARRAEVRS